MTTLAKLPEIVQESHLEATLHPNEDIVKTTMHKTYSGRWRTQQEQWERKKILGKRGFGIVWLEERVYKTSTGYNLRAVKQLDISGIKSKYSDHVRELEALTTFSQQKYVQFFVKSHGWFGSPSSLFIAMEYCPNGDLKRYLENNGKLPEAQAQNVAWQILQGLRFMHQNDFAHRDLKPANILIKSKPPEGKWHVKICDLRLSKRVGTKAESTTAIGTPGFMAPEAISGIGSDTRTFDPFMADMRCLGETVFYMLTFKATFDNLILLSEYHKGNVEFPTKALGETTQSGVLPQAQKT
ncbi:hypothetical protein FSARC_9301 [Fusarium sarcochroum]|uniref:Protein kinase domain-containing protein n=1 Tax=Fusarium sarcochroum TaxID=1208366 RepID=A0A8H4TR71_9HYPO|nr:hypothetical protein FSARC_9301 [Fusarium sarcochroum]